MFSAFVYTFILSATNFSSSHRSLALFFDSFTLTSSFPRALFAQCGQQYGLYFKFILFEMCFFFFIKFSYISLLTQFIDICVFFISCIMSVLNVFYGAHNRNLMKFWKCTKYRNNTHTTQIAYDKIHIKTNLNGILIIWWINFP